MTRTITAAITTTKNPNNNTNNKNITLTDPVYFAVP